MLEQISQIANDAPLLAYGVVLAAGVLTSLGPCNLAMVPVVIAFVGGGGDMSKARAFTLSALFALGSAVTFAVLGLVVAFVGGLFGAAQTILFYIVAAVCITVGLSLLGVIKVNIPGFSAQGLAGRLRKGLAGAFLLGMVMGLAGSQCGTPALVAILSIVMAKGQVLYGASLLFIYGIGRGVPIVLAGTSAGALASSPQIQAWSSRFETAAGVILVAVGIFFVWYA